MLCYKAFNRVHFLTGLTGLFSLQGQRETAFNAVIPKSTAASFQTVSSYIHVINHNTKKISTSAQCCYPTIGHKSIPKYYLVSNTELFIHMPEPKIKLKIVNSAVHPPNRYIRCCGAVETRNDTAEEGCLPACE